MSVFENVINEANKKNEVKNITPESVEVADEGEGKKSFPERMAEKKNQCYAMIDDEEAYPHLLFAKDGEIYTIEGKSYLAIGGAYSVDKSYRIERNYGWWSDEQPSEEIKRYVESQIDKVKRVDYVLSHTCPFRYEPREAFLNFIDQSTVDDSTERWLDKIEETLEYKLWFCGHWHIDKRIDKMHFLFKSFEGQ